MSILHVIAETPALFFTLVAFTSLVVGSFLNVVIHRLPIMMEREWRESLAEFDAEPGTVVDSESAQATASSINMAADGSATHPGIDSGDPQTSVERFNLAVPRSRCPGCAAPISAWQNIPIISWLLLRGRCAHCQVAISVRYPLIEATTMLLSLVVAWQFGATPQAVLGIVVTWFLVALTMIDVDHHLLPDNLTLPLMWIGLMASLAPVFVGVHEAVVGAAAGYLILWSIYWLFKLVTGKEGMGYGDFKLLAALGALLGWQALPMIILLSSLVGAVVGLSIILITRRSKEIPIPFGPYLAAAGWIAMVWGDSLQGAYFTLFMP